MGIHVTMYSFILNSLRRSVLKVLNISVCNFLGSLNKKLPDSTREEDCGLDGQIFADWKDDWTSGWDKHIFPAFKHIVLVRCTFPVKDH
jgi:hypothetical protein